MVNVLEIFSFSIDEMKTTNLLQYLHCCHLNWHFCTSGYLEDLSKLSIPKMKESEITNNFSIVGDKNAFKHLKKPKLATNPSNFSGFVHL